MTNSVWQHCHRLVYIFHASNWVNCLGFSYFAFCGLSSICILRNVAHANWISSLVAEELGDLRGSDFSLFNYCSFLFKLLLRAQPIIVEKTEKIVFRL
jgi:hypothetical protein